MHSIPSVTFIGLDTADDAVNAALDHLADTFDVRDLAAALHRWQDEHHTAAPEPLSPLLHPRPVATESVNWDTQPTHRNDVIAATAAADDNGHGLELWVQFLKFIKEAMNWDTLVVRENKIREYTADVFVKNPETGKDDSKRIGGFYRWAQTIGILTVIDTEKSTHKGNTNKDAKVYEVNARILNLALRDPEQYAPKSYRAAARRRGTLTVVPEPEPVVEYNDEDGALF